MNPALIKQLGNFRVVYAEDEEGVRRSVAEMLELLFKEVYLASDGQEALELYEDHKPDLIITDIKMPRMSGIELVRAIRETGSSTPIIVISAHTEVDYMLDAIELSLVRYIVKPITETKLMSALEKFVETSSSKDQIPLMEGWEIDFAKSVILSPKEELPMTKKEAKLLRLFVHKDAVISYEEIENELWPNEYMSLNALRLLIKNLRKKLPDGVLKNIQGVGYKL